jgi:hypothetical protein
MKAKFFYISIFSLDKLLDDSLTERNLMKHVVHLFFVAWLVALCISPDNAKAQVTFQNLDFESAILSPALPNQYPNLVPISSALPDWTGYLGAEQQTQVEYNALTSGDANIAVLGPTWSTSEPGIIDGNYSVLLEAGAVPSGYTGNASIEQTGTIPANAESMQLKAWVYGNPSDFGISFAGNTLTPILLSSGASYNTYGINIAPYAGQTGSLELSAIFDTQGATWINFDDISFVLTPEPSIVALTAISGLLFGARKWFARR